MQLLAMQLLDMQPLGVQPLEVEPLEEALQQIEVADAKRDRDD